MVRFPTTIALLTAVLLVVAVVAPCAETSCSSACCDEIVPTQQFTAFVQPSVLVQPPAVAGCPPTAGSERPGYQCAVAAERPFEVADPFVYRLRI